MRKSIKKTIVVLMSMLTFFSVSPDLLFSAEELPAGILSIMEGPRYKNSTWGILVKDIGSGEVLYAFNADKLFVPASTTKLFTMAAGLTALGPDYRFRTPVYRTGEIDPSRTLEGDLVLVASGDLTMGGRTMAGEKIAYTDVDHTGAGLDGELEARLTGTDPLAGLDKLARQVAASGIRRVNGDVIIDDRLFETMVAPNGIKRTPIMINENVIDLMIEPSRSGENASVKWRPKTRAYKVDAQVRTGPPGIEPQVEVSSPSPGLISVRGEVPEKYQTVIRNYHVEDPAAFARILFIEALERAGITVNAPLKGTNPSGKLPQKGVYDDSNRVALLLSPPYKETVKLILKVSHNLGADTTPLLIAVNTGKNTFEEGMLIERDIFRKMRVDTDAISISDGAGGDRGDLISPAAVVRLLSSMRASPYFEPYYDALPVLGVDGTLAHAVKPDSPVRGNVHAKTGTIFWGNLLNDKPIMISKGLAGYMTTSKGRELVFALYVNNVDMETVYDMGRIGGDLGSICEVIFEKE